MSAALKRTAPEPFLGRGHPGRNSGELWLQNPKGRASRHLYSPFFRNVQPTDSRIRHRRVQYARLGRKRDLDHLCSFGHPGGRRGDLCTAARHMLSGVCRGDCRIGRYLDRSEVWGDRAKSRPGIDQMFSPLGVAAQPAVPSSLRTALHRADEKRATALMV